MIIRVLNSRETVLLMKQLPSDVWLNVVWHARGNLSPPLHHIEILIGAHLAKILGHIIWYDRFPFSSCASYTGKKNRQHVIGRIYIVLTIFGGLQCAIRYETMEDFIYTLNLLNIFGDF